MRKAEPPSSTPDPASALFLIGKDGQGNWVVKDQLGLRGGLFISYGEALKFALFENGHQRQAIVPVPGLLELDVSRATKPTGTLERRRAA